MAVRNDFTAGEVLAAADLNDTFASKLPYSYGTATPSTTIDGFLWYDENDTPPTPKFWDGAAFQSIGGGGKIVQIVRATDATTRTTTSATFVDANISVTITPTDSASAILIIWSANIGGEGGAPFPRMQITDNSNNAISGAEDAFFGVQAVIDNYHGATLIAYSTPATTSAVTYKGRFRIGTGTTARLSNADRTGQLYAIEVAA